MGNPDINIDAWLRGRRAEAGLSQPAAAVAIGVSERLLGAWERAERVPDKIAHVRLLAKWSGIEPALVLAMIPSRSDTEAA